MENLKCKKKEGLTYDDFALHPWMQSAIVVECSRGTKLVLECFSCGEVA